MTLGDKIHLFRKRKNLTLDELASMVSTTKQTIYKYENGIISNVPFAKIEALAKALDVSSNYLIGWEFCDENMMDAVYEEMTKQSIKLPELATKTEIPRDLIFAYFDLNGEVYIEDFIKICNVLGFTFEEFINLYDFSEEPIPPIFEEDADKYEAFKALVRKNYNTKDPDKYTSDLIDEVFEYLEAYHKSRDKKTIEDTIKKVNKLLSDDEE